MVYIRDPLPLPFATPMKIRMGRTTISLQAKRTWTAAMRAFFFGSNQTDNSSIAVKSRTSEANRASVASVDNGEDIASSVSPIDVQQFLATLNSLPGDKNDLDANNLNNTALMNFRSYTIRTINDAGSVDGADVNDEDLGSQRYDHYAYLSQQLAALVPPGNPNSPALRHSFNGISNTEFASFHGNPNNAIIYDEVNENSISQQPMAMKASPRLVAEDGEILRFEQKGYEEDDEDIIKVS